MSSKREAVVPVPIRIVIDRRASGKAVHVASEKGERERIGLLQKERKTFSLVVPWGHSNVNQYDHFRLEIINFFNNNKI